MPHLKFPNAALAAAIFCLGLPIGAAGQGAGGGTSGGTAGSNSKPAASEPAASTRSASTPSASTPSVSTSRDAPGASVSPQERQFIEKAAIGGMAEVELGQIAQQKGFSDQVKQFGEVMVRDHGNANEELEQLAQRLGVKLPGSLDKMHQETVQKLQKLSGAEFDREYIEQMLADHKETISDFERQSRQGNDVALKSFAAKNLLILKEHLKMAQAIDRNMQGK